MSILAVLALAVTLVATPSTVQSRPLALVSSEHALQQGTLLLGAGRQLRMSETPPLYAACHVHCLFPCIWTAVHLIQVEF